jgi:hypothetical protein
MKSFHFSLGDSSDGPIGFCASIKAKTQEDALAALRDAIEAINREHSLPDDRGNRAYMSVDSVRPTLEVEYIQVYFNPDKITLDDIDDEDDDKDNSDATGPRNATCPECTDQQEPICKHGLKIGEAVVA